ncbi:MAG: hypothetical protein HC876_09745 [Chloroflexaceae bacterium]|nr:hypothetical protein [Chloroflexaceae bacterium]
MRVRRHPRLAETPTAEVASQPSPVPSREPTARPTAAPTAAPTATATPQPAVTIVDATFARGLTADFQPIDPGNTFQPGQTVHLAVTVQGRPVEGTVTARYYFRDEQILTTDFDMSEVNSDVLFTFDDNTFIGYTLTATNPLPISDNYRADILVDGTVVETLPFSIVPPSEAIASAIVTATLASGIDVANNPLNQSSTFLPGDTVFLVGRGNFGIASTLRAEWYRGIEQLEGGTRSLSLDENLTNSTFYFNFLPEGGWQPGDYAVALLLNDREVGRYPFSIAEASAMPPPELARAFVDTRLYEYPTGLFAIGIPQDWRLEDDSSAESANLTWTSSTNNMLVNVNIVQRSIGDTDLGSVLTQEITAAFGRQPDFQISSPQLQPDGSVLVGFRARTDTADSLLMQGNAYAEQLGDTFSVLVLIAPSDQFEALWDAGLSGIANSYTVDPTARLRRRKPWLRALVSSSPTPSRRVYLQSICRKAGA